MKFSHHSYLKKSSAILIGSFCSSQYVLWMFTPKNTLAFTIVRFSFYKNFFIFILFLQYKFILKIQKVGVLVDIEYQLSEWGLKIKNLQVIQEDLIKIVRESLQVVIDDPEEMLFGLQNLSLPIEVLFIIHLWD